MDFLDLFDVELVRNPEVIVSIRGGLVCFFISNIGLVDFCSIVCLIRRLCAVLLILISHVMADPAWIECVTVFTLDATLTIVVPALLHLLLCFLTRRESPPLRRGQLSLSVYGW